MIKVSALITCLALPVQAANFEFCWEGANGYRLDGVMTVSDDALSQPLITEADVTAFKIAGTHNGIPIGGWSMASLTPTTSWNVNFDPVNMVFVTGGFSSTSQGQEWNANGAVNDCGPGGFGFNSGSGGQDVCVDGVYIVASSIYEATPFPVYEAGTLGTCSGSPLLGGLWPQPQKVS